MLFLLAFLVVDFAPGHPGALHSLVFEVSQSDPSAAGGGFRGRKPGARPLLDHSFIRIVVISQEGVGVVWWVCLKQETLKTM